ncbi:MAG: hypothetical protein H7221_02150 [Flavobacterium sp.]|nr:hypothetical protein [Flavobacterium sp.]
MQNTKNSKEVQGTGTAQEQMLFEFNSATKELFTNFELDFIKPNYEVMIYGWIYSENCNASFPNERADIYFFNRQFLEFLTEVSTGTSDVKTFINFVDGWDLESSIKRLFEVYDGYLHGEDADDKNIRINCIWLYDQLKIYFKTIYEIYQSHRAELKLTA